MTDHELHNYKPVIGQEAVVPCYGLGRVTSFSDRFPHHFIEVRPYINDVPMKFDPRNVRLVDIHYQR